jgi:hypothetical protein
MRQNSDERVRYIYFSRQHVKNKHYTCFSTTFDESVEVNQATSFFIGREIKWISPTKASECVFDDFYLDAFDFLTVNLANGIPNTTRVFDFWTNKRHKQSFEGIWIFKQGQTLSKIQVF